MIESRHRQKRMEPFDWIKCETLNQSREEKKLLFVLNIIIDVEKLHIKLCLMNDKPAHSHLPDNKMRYTCT